MRILAVLIVMVCGCADPAWYGGEGGVQAKVGRAGVELQNERARAIYYHAADRETAARIMWRPCDEPARCDAVAAGARVLVPGTAIIGWRTSPEVIVYWWHLDPSSSGGFRVDSVRHVIARR
jgi:hypothetical protein